MSWRDEADGLFARKWRALPDAQRTPQQVAGVAAVACGATHSIMERCNFACTSCYLTELANATEPLPFPQTQAQLHELRRHLGDGGKAQITSGEVTLLPVSELGRIVAYARQIGLDPMVMTNGERWLESPEQLEALVREYGLDKVSIHIDTTQRGRRELVLGLSERDLHPLRDRFAGLIRDVRRKTGRAVHAAQTVTVTEDNLDGVPDVTRWALDHADAFRLVSFLPVASVGRTEDRRSSAITLERVWEFVCVGAGKNLNRHAMHFGHTECNITVPLVVLRCGGERHLVEVVRADEAWDLSVFSWVLRNLHPVLEFRDGLAANALRIFKGVLTRPRKALEFLAYALYRLWGERQGMARLARELVRFRRLRVHPILLVVHKFMNPGELDTPLGRERLDSCVFKLPVNGRMVSMCEMNGTGLRRELNQVGLRVRAPEWAAELTSQATPERNDA